MSSKLLYAAAKKTLVEYLNKTSLNGCYLLYYIRRRKYQRLFWFMFIVMAVAFASYVCTTILMMFLRDPTVTTMDPQKYSVYDVPFPSVAVCSYNKFSRKAIRKYARNITLHDSKENSLEYWEQRLEMLSGIYNCDSIDFDEATKLQNDLESILGEPFKTGKIIKMLAPLCENLLLKCFWAGEVINCREKLQLQMFMDGPCCVFNYQYMSNLDSLYYPKSTGSEMGLVLFLNLSTNDYFYAEESTIGFRVKLFSSQRIPDPNMGDVEEFHVGAEQDVNVVLKLFSQVAMKDVQVYSVHRRGCYFPLKRKGTLFHKSDCLLKCKSRFIQSNCECTPFYASKYDTESNKGIDECSLLNLECFEYFKYKMLDSLTCSNCFPECSYHHYYFHKTSGRLRDTLRHYSNKRYFGNISDVPQDISLVKIYYKSDTGTRYYKKPLYKWYHILSTIGGVIGICMGCSIVNFIEIIYFGCFRLLEKFLTLKKTQ